MTVSLVGRVEGVCGRSFMNESGVFGGSRFGLTFFHASTKLESTEGVAGTSVEKRRRETPERRAEVARRSIAILESDRSVSLGRRERERVKESVERERVRRVKFEERNGLTFVWTLEQVLRLGVSG